MQTRKARLWLKELALEALDRWELDSLLKRWQAIDEEWQALEEKVRARQAEHPLAPLVATMPGRGLLGRWLWHAGWTTSAVLPGPRVCRTTGG